VRAFPLSAPADSAERAAKPVQSVAGGVAGGVPGGVEGGVPGGVAGGVAAGVQEEPTKAPPVKKRRGIVYKVDPQFPDKLIDKKVRSREDVVLAVTIEKSGEVSDVKVVKGHPSFNESAVAAVKQWKFEPSEQSPAMATITIRFVPPPPPPPPPPPAKAKPVQ
jgi:protein TonB